MIHTKQLTYTYPGSKPIRFPDIQCQSGEIVLVLGNSGVGKTTLLHLVGGLLSIQTGDIIVHDTSLSSLSGVALDKFRGQHIGIIFQQNHFVESLNVLENCLLAQSLAGRKPDKKRAQELLDHLSMGHHTLSGVKKLSQGEKQRVAIARALINQPDVILADEPTSALDDDNCRQVLHLLQDQAKAAGAALVVVTHDNRLKSEIANQIILEKE